MFMDRINHYSFLNLCIILDLKPFRSWVKRKHSLGREFQSPAVGQKKLLTVILVTSRNDAKKNYAIY